ncbi:ATP-grasp domain-containing protein [uncultured Allomuricauda sp.]|uniref:ATP-grasp domain-containing protein n=1 Tax=Flagellimonas sp. W118 TaxID=3410791 RepID=UPI00261DF018|nr:ATP-grasp domain-containing protein [uncultured Allomuricauda sp.]
MKNTNILFTCAGRRNYLIKYFKEALNGNGNVVAVDMQLSAPALVDADIARKVPNIYDPAYIPALKKVIKEERINAVISLNDLELPILSKHKKDLENQGAKIIISDPNAIGIAFDKWRTFTFFKNIGVNTPKTYLTIQDALDAIQNSELIYPLIIKPRWGSASISIDIAENEKELKLAYNLQHIKVKRSILKNASSEDIEKSILIQEKIDGEEYGIDILNDFEGNHYDSFVRKKLAMRSGETDKAVSIIDSKFSETAKIIAENTKHVGNMDCDFFVHKNEIYYLEMNPRFGGGYPFSHEAGINTPAIYISWLNGQTDVDKFNNFAPGLTFSKYDNLMKISED